MTGPDDAFLAPDDALYDGDEDTRPGADDVERPPETVAPREDGIEDADRASGSVEHETGSGPERG
ncbi:hypothetical protein [Geodermatophilus sabuli]|uniref:Uncharacterized protein n=1 Tax=Geodermatophilus sabuli TaxID=1564158 RepID=A0A285EED0_9ACTN|nr:hypothetical protein [Geodermatophilus sabuli]MBB3086390.1 hypothetical protein [Geodermatophilus sabuli]SNX97395.1 hypothetical protein SAMN06893097_10735 [Geodermatophilus sabuli]